MPTTCSQCGIGLANLIAGKPDSNFELVKMVNGFAYCGSCVIKNKAKAAASAVGSNLMAATSVQASIKAEDVIVTTTPAIDGYKVVKVVDVITAECFFGMNIFKDFFSDITDFFGGRNTSSQKALKEARQLCIKELKEEAAKINANAVIGIDLDYSEFSGKGKSMLFLVASGTAVVLEKQASPNQTINASAFR